jgi:hypothetical protein
MATAKPKMMAVANATSDSLQNRTAAAAPQTLKMVRRALAMFAHAPGLPAHTQNVTCQLAPPVENIKLVGLPFVRAISGGQVPGASALRWILILPASNATLVIQAGTTTGLMPRRRRASFQERWAVATAKQQFQHSHVKHSPC